MAQTLENLISQLEKEQPYKPLAQQEIDQRAQQRYQAVYDQKRLSAQKSYESSDAALARELSGLQKTYDARRAAQTAQTRDAYSQADRHALSRGMQRSSYNEANLTNIRLSGDAAQRSIDREQTEEENRIGSERTQLSTQLAHTLKQLDTDQKNDEMAYADELADREYERATESSSAFRQLAAQLYEYQHELEQEMQEHARWQAEFNARYGAAPSSGSGRKTASGARQAAAAAGTTGTSGSIVRRTQREMMN